MSSKVSSEKKSYLSVLSGTIVSICVTLVLILLFAVLIRFCNISDGWIFPINQIIKCVSMFVGAIIFLKKQNKNGFFKGLILGISYFVLSFIVFSILQGSFAFSLSNLYDLLLTTLMGGLIGIIVVNVIK